MNNFKLVYRRPTPHTIPSLLTMAFAPRLDTLSNELIDEICSYLPPIFTQGPAPWSTRFDRDFFSLRSTCRNLYVATHREFLMRFLRDPDSHQEFAYPNQLAILYHFSTIPILRDVFQSLRILTSPWSAGNIDGDMRRYMMDIEQKRYEQSPEAIYLLAQSFTNFAVSPNLETIIIVSKFPSSKRRIHENSTHTNQYSHLPENHHAVLAALTHSQFSRKLENIQNVETLTLEHEPESSITRLHFSMNTTSSESCPLIMEYHNSTPLIEGYLRPLQSVRELVLDGQRSSEPLRPKYSYQGWTTLFSKSFYQTFYPNLHTLRMHKIYVPGLGLRKFVQSNSSILSKIEMTNVYLISGSWLSVFGALENVIGLEHLWLGYLYHLERWGHCKGSGRPSDWPQGTAPRFDVEVEICGEEIVPFLQRLVENFGYIKKTWRWMEIDFSLSPSIDPNVTTQNILQEGELEGASREVT